MNPHSRNAQGDTALRFAVDANDYPMVKYLVEDVGLDVNAVNRSGTSPLLIATFNNNTNLIIYLAYMGANVNQHASAVLSKDIGGVEVDSTVSEWTPLMAAAQLGYNDSVTELLASGANINALDSDRWNALMFAVQNGHVSTARLLLDKGINYNIETTDHFTPLTLAIQNGDQEMIDMLERVGAIESSVPLTSYANSYTYDIDEGGYDYEDYTDFEVEPGGYYGDYYDDYYDDYYY